MSPGLVDVYGEEQNAERSTYSGDIPNAIQHHEKAILELNMIIEKIIQKKQHENDEFGVIDSLVVMRKQIESRIDQLRKIKPNSSSLDGNTIVKNKEAVESIPLLNSALADIQVSLLKNLNIRLKDHNSSKKIPFVNNFEINKIEHELQLLNFKSSHNINHRNELLTKLNMLYYGEMMNQREFIKDVVDIVKLCESRASIDKDWKKIDQITDDRLLGIVNELQERINRLEREKLHMEHEIITLKEKLNRNI